MKTLGIANNEKLINIINQMRDGLLNLKPAFQRNLVWSNKHKENFIETIQKQLPFPEVYFCEGEVDIESQKSTRLVVDGQQRLSAIHNYIKGELSCGRIKSFSELTDNEKKDFFNYQVVVRDLGNIDADTIREVFRRINSVRYALNAMEIRNALYEGEFIATAQHIAASKELEVLDVFTMAQQSRMKHAEFALLVMTTIEVGGYFSSDDEVETLIKAFDDKYPESKRIAKDIIQSLRLIIKAKLPLDSIWFRLSSFFSLVVELVKYRREKEGEVFSSSTLRRKLFQLGELIEKHKNGDISKDQYARYHHYTFQGTANKIGRIARGEVLEKHLRLDE